MSDEIDPAKKEWLDKVRATFRFHRSKLGSHDNWTATLTARALRRSIGSISEDLKVARWLRTHENEIVKCKGLKDAIAWIKEKEKKMKLEDIE